MSLNELIADAEASARRGVPVDWRQMTYTAVNLANNYVTMMQNQMAAARNNPEAAK